VLIYLRGALALMGQRHSQFLTHPMSGNLGPIWARPKWQSNSVIVVQIGQSGKAVASESRCKSECATRLINGMVSHRSRRRRERVDRLHFGSSAYPVSSASISVQAVRSIAYQTASDFLQVSSP